eukprot:1195930-Prorocentrum_minimum.AAC.5
MAMLQNTSYVPTARARDCASSSGQTPPRTSLQRVHAGGVRGVPAGRVYTFLSPKEVERYKALSLYLLGTSKVDIYHIRSSRCTSRPQYDPPAAASRVTGSREPRDRLSPRAVSRRSVRPPPPLAPQPAPVPPEGDAAVYTYTGGNVSHHVSTVWSTRVW